MSSLGLSGQVNVQLKIKPEYANEWGILPDDKYRQLKESIKQSGQLKPIVVDQYWNIVDGYNRYQILMELGDEPIFEVRHFEDESSALDYVISANLFVKESSPFVRIKKAERLRHIFEEKAKHNGQLKLPNKGQKGFQPINAQNFAPIGRVSKQLGKIANVSYRTVEKAEKIEKLVNTLMIFRL